MNSSKLPNQSDREICEALSNAQRILITTHIRPDGDAIGSLLGLSLSLIDIQKHTQMVIQGGFPAKYRFLIGSEKIKECAEDPFDFVISLDCADQSRAGDILANRQPDLNIDHHETNTLFGKINLVCPEYAATTAILAEKIPQWGLPITPPSANALLTGIVTDTIGFRTPNVNSTLLRMAA